MRVLAGAREDRRPAWIRDRHRHALAVEAIADIRPGEGVFEEPPRGEQHDVRSEPVEADCDHFATSKAHGRTAGQAQGDLRAIHDNPRYITVSPRYPGMRRFNPTPRYAPCHLIPRVCTFSSLAITSRFRISPLLGFPCRRLWEP